MTENATKNETSDMDKGVVELVELLRIKDRELNAAAEHLGAQPKNERDPAKVEQIKAQAIAQIELLKLVSGALESKDQVR